MNRKARTRRKNPSSRSLAAEESGRSAAPPAQPFAEAETEGAAEEQALLGDAAAGAREETARLREEAADLREEAADLREEAADLREEAADLREEAAELREGGSKRREKALRAQEESARRHAAGSARSQAQLREANERLVVASIRAQTMTEAAELAAARMSYMAEHDFLTGLPNRSVLTDRLAQSIALAQRHGKKVALMYIDLDHFKHINDSLGHAVGDQLLQSAATRLQRCVRLTDTVSRQGGDEFVVLLAEVRAAQDAVLTAEKLIEAMAEPHLIDGHRLHVTLSVGISLYPDDGAEADTLLGNADTAMYHAKKSGRNRYKLFSGDMNTRAVARQSVEAALRRALDQHEFVVHYQPKVDLATGTITGAEALLRWQRPDRRLASPAEFIGIAEHSGLILPIGKWVLREACRQTQAWLQAGLEIGQVAVNVSAEEFHGRDFLAGVGAILDETGLAPGRLEVELTESGLMQDAEPATATLHALKALGLQIAVDHFGTGYSSLGYLRRCPIDTLKIDQSFVQDINDDTDQAVTVEAIIAMGRSLSQRVVAEGIETRQQLAFLQSHQCAEGQGHFFSRPVPAEEFAALLAAGRA
jgi:diguanylate cyclase